MLRYIQNDLHYTLLMEEVTKVKHTLWMGTADLKDLYVKQGRSALPFLALPCWKRKSGKAFPSGYSMPKSRARISGMISINILRYGTDWSVRCVRVFISS